MYIWVQLRSLLRGSSSPHLYARELRYQVPFNSHLVASTLVLFVTPWSQTKPNHLMTGFHTCFISFRSSFCSNTAFLGHPTRNKSPLHFSPYTHPFFPTVQSPSDIPHICIYLTFPLRCKLESRGIFYSLLCLQCLIEESLKYSSSYTYLWDTFFSEFKDSWHLKTKRCQIFELFVTLFSDPP